MAKSDCSGVEKLQQIEGILVKVYLPYLSNQKHQAPGTHRPNLTLIKAHFSKV